MPRPEIIGMPCMSTSTHAPHEWQYSATGYVGCPGIPPNVEIRRQP